uniref:GrBNV_gp97-like protein n=1 Tax=Nilaparvata lugens endogenous nudivirus TaxID=1487700 RepID=X5G6L3_9VIRU|nr:GrBNV_gp97-like protein [Nilaparvata lugens endogenous nudivirus]
MNQSCPRIKRFYDESIFVDGLSLHGVTEIGVNNRADKFLVERFNNKRATSICAKMTLNALNAIDDCSGVNIYTLDSKNKHTLRVYPFNQIRVGKCDGESILEIKRLEIEQPPGVVAPSTSLMMLSKNKVSTTEVESIPFILDMNTALTQLEHAIMIKYYALHNKVTITNRLFHTIANYLNDSRVWFDNTLCQDTIVQRRGTLYMGDRELLDDLPTLPYEGETLTLY